ncbi:MAG TPA: glycosyltransferase family 4 protein [Rhodanobacteraceae bacterium]|nr:glycosyltransferase family 4 protein [Rhodanobacteraceae bacterium]
MQQLASPVSAWIPAMVAATVISAAATWLAIGYARRRRLIDEPGVRRSHREPTPRGGGVGIAIAVLVCACAPALFHPALSRLTAPALLVSVAIVALVGWIDDHRGLSARWRFAAHCLAAIAFLAPVIVPLILVPEAVEHRFALSAAIAWIVVVVTILAIVWFINLHNFMDGTDGILAAQSIFVFLVLTFLCARAGEAHAGQIAVFAAATVGFLPFNFPRARIFMGDVGSGVLGLLIAIAVIWQMSARQTAIASGIILSSAFVIDATCTLISRMFRGRRWYSAHREHLYQWLARSGFSHTGVVALYFGWNLVIALPVVAWINRPPDLPMSIANQHIDWTPDSGIAAAAVVYLLGVAVWFAGKRYCLNASRGRSSHAAA